MKRLLFLVIASVLFLASCGGSSYPSAADYDLATKEGLADYVNAFYGSLDDFAADDVTINDDAGSDEAKLIVLANVTYSGDKNTSGTQTRCKGVAQDLVRDLKNADAPVSDVAIFYTTPHGDVKIAFENFEIVN